MHRATTRRRHRLKTGFSAMGCQGGLAAAKKQVDLAVKASQRFLEFDKNNAIAAQGRQTSNLA